jgi:hypothetical protein
MLASPLVVSYEKPALAVSPWPYAWKRLTSLSHPYAVDVYWANYSSEQETEFVAQLISSIEGLICFQRLVRLTLPMVVLTSAFPY